MIQVNVDHQGRLTFFEAIPPQAACRHRHAGRGGLDAALSIGRARSIDDCSLRTGVDIPGRIRYSRRVDGQWPDSGRPLRVEAAAFGGRPVAFM
jgi:hypothetical protein